MRVVRRFPEQEHGLLHVEPLVGVEPLGAGQLARVGEMAQPQL